MERFWTLKYLEQNGITELEATVFKEGTAAPLVRADALPLVFPVLGRKACRAARASARRLGDRSADALDVHGTLLDAWTTLQTTATTAPWTRGRRRAGRPHCHCAGRQRTGRRASSTDNPLPRETAEAFPRQLDPADRAGRVGRRCMRRC